MQIYHIIWPTKNIVWILNNDGKHFTSHLPSGPLSPGRAGGRPGSLIFRFLLAAIPVPLSLYNLSNSCIKWPSRSPRDIDTPQTGQLEGSLFFLFSTRSEPQNFRLGKVINSIMRKNSSNSWVGVNCFNRGVKRISGKAYKGLNRSKYIRKSKF